jgi:hypothetical protein
MESLAVMVAIILFTIYGSGLIAFVLSWFANRVARVICFVFSGVAILTGLWLGVTLASGNGLMVGALPVIAGSVSIWNAIRVSKRTN